VSADRIDTSGVLPLWMVEIYHSEPGPVTNPWFRMVNAIDEKAALNTAVHLFTADSLNVVTIYRIVIQELLPIEEGGEDA